MADAKNGLITLSQLMSDVRETKATWLQYEVTFTYKPSAMTPAYFARAREWADKEAMSEAIKSMVFDVLTGWSIVDDNHVMVPITMESLDMMPNDLLWAIHNAAVEDLRPKVTSVSSSNGSSSSAATPA